jgi:uncharacterized protein (DUF433 family)
MLPVHEQSPPIQLNDEGDALIAGTRVRLETIVTAFRRGDSPEQIVDSFDSLSLAHVYRVIAYYLEHQAEVDAYINSQRQAAQQVQQMIETNRPEMLAARTRLLAKKRVKPHAPAGG